MSTAGGCPDAVAAIAGDRSALIEQRRGGYHLASQGGSLRKIREELNRALDDLAAEAGLSSWLSLDIADSLRFHADDFLS
jgi:hypothetical protein